MGDFGVGFSSLSRLQLLPISELKIDRSFVQFLQEDSQDAAIVEAVALLEGFGCTHVQGYGLARPMPAEAILEVGASQDAIRASAAAVTASRSTRRPT